MHGDVTNERYMLCVKLMQVRSQSGLHDMIYAWLLLVGQNNYIIHI